MTINRTDSNLFEPFKDMPMSLIAFGYPSDPRTFSGYSCHLARALHHRGLLKDEYSIKNMRTRDILNGAFRGHFASGRLKLKINREWMWSRSGNLQLTSRLHRRISINCDPGPFLQIGTLVPIAKTLGAHFVLTDMTIPQAHNVGCFDVAGMSEKAVRQALEVQRSVFLNARAIFTLSDWTRRSVIEDFGIDDLRVKVIHAGPNLEIRPGLLEKKNIHEILFVGIDWQRKGGDVLIEAFNLVRIELPDARLTIVGCRPPVNAPGICVEGFLDRRIPSDAEKLERCYLRAGCFCLPSRFDPFPNAIIEAGSAGLPSVAIDNGSRREAIVDGVTGRLVGISSACELANALCWVLKNEQRRQQLGDAAKNHVEKNFTWNRVVDKIVRTIKTTMADEDYFSL